MADGTVLGLLELLFQKEWRIAKISANGRNIRNLMVRRKRIRETFLFTLTKNMIGRELNVERRFWLEPGRAGSFFWERTVSSWLGSDNENLWLENFRMTKATFMFICQQLDGKLRKKNTRMRNAIPPEKRIAMCIWHLATGEDLRSLGWRFDTGEIHCLCYS